MGRERHIKTQAEAARGWEAVKDGTVPPDALLANGLQLEPKVYLCFSKNSQSSGDCQAGSFSHHQSGGIGSVGTGRENLERQQAARRHLTGTFHPLSKAPLLASLAICREIVLVLGQDCFIQRGGSLPGALSARESGNRIVETMIYLVHGMS